jgi:hypothetical protein
MDASACPTESEQVPLGRIFSAGSGLFGPRHRGLARLAVGAGLKPAPKKPVSHRIFP